MWEFDFWIHNWISRTADFTFSGRELKFLEVPVSMHVHANFIRDWLYDPWKTTREVSNHQPVSTTTINHPERDREARILVRTQDFCSNVHMQHYKRWEQTTMMYMHTIQNFHYLFSSSRRWVFEDTLAYCVQAVPYERHCQCLLFLNILAMAWAKLYYLHKRR